MPPKTKKTEVPKVDKTETKKKVTKTKRTNQVEFKFVSPSKSHMMTGFGLILVGFVFFALVLVFGRGEVKNNLGRAVNFFDSREKNLEMKYHLLKMKENLNMEKHVYVGENEYSPKMVDNGIDNMFFLSELGKEVDTEDIFKLYKDYAFIEDLKTVEEVITQEEQDIGDSDDEDEADEKKQEKKIIVTSKPQSIYATYYAHQLLKQKGEFEGYVKKEQFKNTVEFVLKMQNNETGIFANDKANATDIKIMFMATSLLKDALHLPEKKVEVENAIELAKKYFVGAILPDGSFDMILNGKNGTCSGTEFAYLAMENLGMFVKPYTKRYVVKCNSEKGPLIDLNGEYINTECGYLLTEIMKVMPMGYQTESILKKDIFKGLSLLFMGFGVAFFFIDTYPKEYVKEYLISSLLFVACGIVSLIFIPDTYLLFLVFPVGIMGYTHIWKWIMPLIKDEFFSTICMIPSLFAGGLWFLLSKFAHSVFFSMSFIPIMWVLFIVGSYLAVPICKLFFKKESHPVKYYVDCNAIGFAFMNLTMFLFIAMSANRVFILNIISYMGYFTMFVAWPAVGYIFSMIAFGLSIPKEKAKGPKTKKKTLKDQ